ncbi:hypothetical protein T5B8_10491 [Salinisphaera sp. T5B8]|uniref:hypothetical protein n=1 Tax=Salinisphaera sp. T5B8 TaxID=1304154 RepID=UPI00334200B7
MNARRIDNLRSALVYLTLVAGVLGLPRLAWFVGAPALILAIVLAWPGLNRIPRVIVSAVLVAIVGALLVEPELLSAGLMTITRLAALVVAVMLLSHALGRSRHLSIISEHLFAGRALTRYLSITFGTLFLAMPLNFGSVSVVSTLIGREIYNYGDSGGARNAARAVLRGFGSASVCSPLSIAVVLTLTLVPGLHGWQLLSLTFPLAAGYLITGTLFREPESAPVPGQARQRPPHVVPSWLFFAACIGLICVCTFASRALFGLAYAQAVTCSCLLVVAIGLLASPGERRLPRMDNISNELAIICGSAFLGATLSAFVAAGLDTDFDLPDWAFPAIAFGLPWVLFAGGLIGMNPLILVTLAGGLSSRLWPEAAGLGLAIAMVSGWGLTIAGTPYSANALLVQRLTGYDNWQATIGWSLALSLLALAVASSLAATTTLVLMP